MSKVKKEGHKGGGNWKDFFHVIRKMRLPWHWIIIAFLCNFLYNRVMLDLPTVTAGPMSGSTDSQALVDAVWFYVLFTLVLCGDVALRSPARHVAAALQTISSYNVWLMVSVFLLLPLKLIYAVFVGRWQYRTQFGVFKEIGSLTAYLAERVRNLMLIKTYTNEERELKNGEKTSYGLFDANMKVNKLNCVITALTTLLGMAQVMVVMVFGVLLLKRGDIDIQQWVAFYMFSGTLSTSFSNLIDYWMKLKSVQGAMARTAELLAAACERARRLAEDF